MFINVSCLCITFLYILSNVSVYRYTSFMSLYAPPCLRSRATYLCIVLHICPMSLHVSIMTLKLKRKLRRCIKCYISSHIIVNTSYILKYVLRMYCMPLYMCLNVCLCICFKRLCICKNMFLHMCMLYLKQTM